MHRSLAIARMHLGKAGMQACICRSPHRPCMRCPHHACMHACTQACSQAQAAAVRPLDASRMLAWARVEECRRPDPLLVDPFAEALLQTSPPVRCAPARCACQRMHAT